MLLYEYQIRDQFERILKYANNVRAKFESGVEVKELLLDSQNLAEIYKSLTEMLPAEIKNTSNFGRHIYFMLNNLSNKDRLCERSEPQSYPVVGQARPIMQHV